MFKFIKTLICLFSVFYSYFSFSQYAGTYTVGGISPHFVNLDSAFKNIEKKGVSGNVRLNVRSGTYFNRFTINKIKGTTSTKIIKVAPDPDNSSPVIIKNKNITISDNYLVKIKGSFLSFDSIEFHIDNASTNYGTIIDFIDVCENISFNYCRFYGVETTLNSGNYTIINCENNYSVKNLKIRDCKFFNGSIAIKHFGNVNYETGFECLNNEIYNSLESIKLVQMQSPLIKGNKVFSNSKVNGDVTAISIDNSKNYILRENKIFMRGIKCNGIKIYKCSGTSTSRNLITNNQIDMYDTSNVIMNQGLYIEGGEHTNVYYNSIRIVSKATGSLGVGITSNRLTFQNNNIINTGKGLALAILNGSTSLDLDYNNYYSAGDFLYSAASVNFKNISNIKNYRGMETHSYGINPKFNGISDLHTSTSQLNGTALNVTEIDNDLDGKPRDTSYPDIGAFEFNTIQNDLQINKVIISRLSDYGSDSSEVGAIIKNLGSKWQTGFKIYLEILKDSFQKLTYYYEDTLNARETDTIYFSKFSTIKEGNYYFKAYPFLPADGDLLNDTSTSYKDIYPSTWPSPKNDTLCNNQSYNLQTNFISNSVPFWYTKKNGGKLITQGNKFLVNKLNKDTSFYISSFYTHLKKSSISTSFIGGVFNSGGLMFDIIPSKKLQIDSFSAAFHQKGTQKVYIYMKKGTSDGFENTPSTWYLEDSITVSPSVITSFVNIPLKKHISLEKDSLYSFYLYYYGDYEFNGISYSNSDISIIPGAALYSKFGIVFKPRTFLGQIFYTTVSKFESDRVPYNIKVKKAPEINLQKDTSFCANNGIHITLNAGKGYKQYNWSTSDTTPIIIVNDHGKYVVRVINNECFASDSVTVTRNTNPIVKLGKDTAYCASVGIKFDLNAGTGFISYKWNHGSSNPIFTANTKGTYYVKVIDKNNCEGMDTIKVIQYPVKPVKLGKDSIYCINNGSSVKLDAGAGFKSYKWSTSEVNQQISVFKSGFYNVSTIDTNNCTYGDSIFISLNENPSINIGRDTFYCASNGINMTLTAGKGFSSYLWSTNEKSASITIKKSGKYFVEVTGGNNCYGSDTININSMLNPIINLGPDIIVHPKLPINKTLNAGEGYKKYEWSTGDNTQTITINKIGKYGITVTDDNGCKGSDTIEILMDPARTLTLNLTHIKVYPNPATNQLKIVSENSVIDKIEVFEISGKSLFSRFSNSKNIELEIVNWANGTYLLVILLEGKIYKTMVEVNH